MQGIYVITDSSDGKQYVGKAAGAERILSRWSTYARDGHGRKVALRELAFSSANADGQKRLKTEHALHYVFSISRVCEPSTPSSEVDDAETHYKEALLTRVFGLNRN